MQCLLVTISPPVSDGGRLLYPLNKEFALKVEFLGEVVVKSEEKLRVCATAT